MPSDDKLSIAEFISHSNHYTDQQLKSVDDLVDKNGLIKNLIWKYMKQTFSRDASYL